MELSVPLFAVTLVFVFLFLVTLALGFYLLLRQQRGERRIDPPLEEIRKIEAEVKRIAKDIQKARYDDSLARAKWFSFGPRSTPATTEPDMSEYEQLNPMKGHPQPPRGLTMWPTNGHPTPAHEIDDREGVGGFMDMESFPDPSRFNGSAPRIGSAQQTGVKIVHVNIESEDDDDDNDDDDENDKSSTSVNSNQSSSSEQGHSPPNEHSRREGAQANHK